MYPLCTPYDSKEFCLQTYDFLPIGTRTFAYRRKLVGAGLRPRPNGAGTVRTIVSTLAVCAAKTTGISARRATKYLFIIVIDKARK